MPTKGEIEGVKAVLDIHGPMTNRDWAIRNLQAKVWPHVPDSEKIIQWAQDRTRDCVRELNKRGLIPYALPCGPEQQGEAPMWKRPEQMTFDEIDWNLIDRKRDIELNMKQFKRLADYCIATHGHVSEPVRLRLEQWFGKADDV